MRTSTCSNLRVFWFQVKRIMCYFLKKSLYDLKQSPRQWYKRFYSFMISHNFKRCTMIVVSTLENVMLSCLYIYSCMWITC